MASTKGREMPVRRPLDPRQRLTHHRLPVSDRRHRTGQAALAGVTDHPLGDPPHRRGVPLRVHALPAYELAHVRAGVLDELGVRRTVHRG